MPNKINPIAKKGKENISNVKKVIELIELIIKKPINTNIDPVIDE